MRRDERAQASLPAGPRDLLHVRGAWVTLLVVAMVGFLVVPGCSIDSGGDGGGGGAGGEGGNAGADGYCTNTCYFAHDGECDDGGDDATTSACDLGTDCADCGERFGDCGDGTCFMETLSSCPEDCDWCGNDTCGALETEESCWADCCPQECGDLVCGPDPVCGRSCGECWDFNPCTVDLCDQGSCAVENVPDGTVLGCMDGMSIDYCFAGDLATVYCGGVCIDDGANATTGCLGTGESCDCFTYATTTPCLSGVQECTLAGDLMLCQDGASIGATANFWEPRSCHWVCIELGYASTVGCGPTALGPDACLCSNQ